MAKPKAAEKPKKPAIRNRIVGSDVVLATDLKANPKNWRKHPETQVSALTGVLQDVGWVQEVIVNKRTGVLVDGHARVEIAAARGESVPVKYVDLSDGEEALILATLDPISALAETDTDALAALLEDVNSDNEAVQSLLSQIAQDKDIVPPEKELNDFSDGYQSEWNILIECDDEKQQTKILTELSEKGIKCRALIS